MINYINSREQNKVFSAADYRALPYKKAVNELDKLELCEAPKQKLSAEIAVRVYYLEDWV